MAALGLEKRKISTCESISDGASHVPNFQHSLCLLRIAALAAAVDRKPFPVTAFSAASVQKGKAQSASARRRLAFGEALASRPAAGALHENRHAFAGR
eukprot:CAMPEP_0170601134 /NCGR_PEP_ID=MMETSP0224-20130122/17699_1 /TAXON_ID=285029 /ORGANISM="Togula jolla, Strain CCCM 725" /LENGTH=97 /DNA_ID=CAMNT_0010925893 /DNA_START=223 /DNA_END=516 /DNA_ORIENTATION=+